MEHETHDITDAKTATRSEKKLLAPTLGRVVERADNRTLRRRLVSKFELPKAEKKSAAAAIPAPETKPAVVETPAPTPESAAIEIPLSDAKAPAEAFIDLRRVQVAEELHKAEPQSVAQAEAAAGATLLGNESQQLEAQSPETPFIDAMQAAQTTTLESLQYPTQALQQVEANQLPVRYEADTPLSSFVQSYLEKREQTVRTIAHEQFDTSAEPPEFSQAMQLADLLAYSERIFIDGTSLRSMYETKQITEAGLRRITAEYLRGGDVRKALGDEHMRNETKFERDPQLRDQADNQNDKPADDHDQDQNQNQEQQQVQKSQDDVDAAKPQSSQDGLTNLHTAPKSTGDSTPGKSHDTKHERKHAEHLFAGAWLILIAVLIVIVGILILR